MSIERTTSQLSRGVQEFGGEHAESKVSDDSMLESKIFEALSFLETSPYILEDDVEIICALSYMYIYMDLIKQKKEYMPTNEVILFLQMAKKMDEFEGHSEDFFLALSQLLNILLDNFKFWKCFSVE